MMSLTSLEAGGAQSITGCIATSIIIAWPTLYDAPRTGRPPTAAQITKARILQEPARDPLKLGYNTTIWTVPLLASHLSRRYHSQITPRTLRRRMKEVGLR